MASEQHVALDVDAAPPAASGAEESPAGFVRPPTEGSASPAASAATEKTGSVKQAPSEQQQKLMSELDELETKLEVKSEDALRGEAKRNSIASGCTLFDSKSGEYKYRPVCGTNITDLGVYGVGVTLYFQFLLQMGIVFLVCAFLTAPNMAINVLGGMVDEENVLFRMVGRLSVANLGACEDGACKTRADMEDRCWMDSFPCDMKLRDVTQWIGLADGLAILVVLAWAVFFQRWWVPRTVTKNDERHLTPSDFTVEIDVLPRRLAEGHEAYEEKLAEHFVGVLRGMAVPVDDSNAVAEVSLIRDYAGAISTFMSKGRAISDMQASLIQKKQALARGDEKSEQMAKRASLKALKQREKLHKIDGRLLAKTQKLDVDRDVVRAFVTFSKDSYASAILNEYRFSRYRLFRCCQGEQLSFGGGRLQVNRACEPSDLFWENLDYSWWKRYIRKAIVVLISIILLAVCSLLLVYFQSQAKALASPEAYKVWIIKSTPDSNTSCLGFCDWKLFDDRNCDDNGLTSDYWPMVKKFDAKNDWPAFNTSAPWTNGCSGLWTSPTCSAIGTLSSCESNVMDWYGYEFTEPRKATCMRASVAASRPAEQVQLYGCAQAPPAVADRSCWKVEEHCEPMAAEDVAVPAKLPKPLATSSFSTGNKKIDPDASCAVKVGLDTAKVKWTSLDEASRATSPLLSCFCSQQMSVIGPQLRLPPYDTEEKEICAEWSYAENMKLARLAGTTIAVLVVNQLLVFIFSKLVTWERNSTITDVALSQLVKLFLAQFVNTGLLVLFVNASLKNIPAWLVPLRVLSIGTGSYDDFTLDWYVSIGSMLCITILGQVFSTTMPPLVMSFCVHPITTRVFGRGQVLQDRLNEVYELPEWNLPLRMAQTMTVIFVIAMYSAGLPVLWAVGFVYCLVAFWLDKWELLRGSKKPPAYRQNVIDICMHMLPLAAFLHTIVACWTMGNQSLFPSAWSRLIGVAEIVFQITLEQYGWSMETYRQGSQEVKRETQAAYVHARILDFAREGCWLLLLIFLVFCAYYIVFWILTIFVKPFIAPFVFALKESCRCGKKGAAGDTYASWEEGKTWCKQHNILDSYKLSANPKYHDAFLALQHDHEQIQKLRKEGSTDI
eukprot:TRINITY_DN8671_c0_g1_i3.p1 TRINITY_DN8671_c0_g1~~TRINITY_DN8671_c0_g1_i3.p1  ORF type:complete len:1119 (-),score=283.36 TRINITY_DN8671_c0_g1_i3:111-3467(-)